MSFFFNGPDSKGLKLTSSNDSDGTQVEGEGATSPLLQQRKEHLVKPPSNSNTKVPPKEAFRLVFPTGAVEDGDEGGVEETNDMQASISTPPNNDQHHQQQEVERNERNQVAFLVVILMACVAVVYWWAYCSSTPIKNT